MKTWIWPLSWYFRIRELEARVQRLEAEKREVSERLLAAVIQQTALTSAYTSAVASIATTVTSFLSDGGHG